MPIVKRIHRPEFFPEDSLAPGDNVTAINGVPLRDVIDARFYAADDDLELTVERADGSVFLIEVDKDIDADLGIEWEPDKIRICKANCDFCFVHQQPRKKLRRTLYIKDDDYRMSFLHGNFVTLTNMTETDYARVFEQKLSPLYVSVHCTDDEVRRRVFRKPDAEPILPLLKRLHDHGIDTHAQIVVTPGLNDGDVLWQSFIDLLALYPNVPSVGVVPIGLTRYRGDLPDLRRVTCDEAARILREVDKHQAAMRRRHGSGVIYAGDDMFLTAGRRLPDASYYDDFCQVENGIGMLRQLLDGYDEREAELPETIGRSRRLCLITGESAAPFIAGLCARTNGRVAGLELIPLTIRNDFWGHMVGTANLLTAADIAAQFKRAALDVDAIVLPPDCLNADNLFLDEGTPESLSGEIHRPVLRSEYDFVETILNHIE